MSDGYPSWGGYYTKPKDPETDDELRARYAYVCGKQSREYLRSLEVAGDLLDDVVAEHGLKRRIKSC